MFAPHLGHSGTSSFFDEPSSFFFLLNFFSTLFCCSASGNYATLLCVNYLSWNGVVCSSNFSPLMLMFFHFNPSSVLMVIPFVALESILYLLLNSYRIYSYEESRGSLWIESILAKSLGGANRKGAPRARGKKTSYETLRQIGSGATKRLGRLAMP